MGCELACTTQHHRSDITVPNVKKRHLTCDIRL